MQMQVMFRWPVKKITDFSVEVQIPTGDSGVPVIHAEFIELYRLNEGEIKKAQEAAIRAVAILPPYFTQRAVDAMNADVMPREAEQVTKKKDGKWTPVVVRPVNDKVE